VGLAPFIDKMLENKWLGDKAKQGFYKKRGQGCRRARSAATFLDWQTLDYKTEHAAPKFPAIEDGEERGVDAGADRAASSRAIRARTRQLAFYWPFLTELFTL